MKVVVSGVQEAFAFFADMARKILFDQIASVINADCAKGRRLVESVDQRRFATTTAASAGELTPRPGGAILDIGLPPGASVAYAAIEGGRHRARPHRV